MLHEEKMLLFLLDGGDRRGAEGQLAVSRAQVWTQDRFLFLMACRGPALSRLPRCPRVRAEASELAFQPRVPRPQLQHCSVCTHLAVCPGAAGMSKSGGQTPTSFRTCGIIGEATRPGRLLTGWTRPAGLAPVPGLLSLCLFFLPDALAPLPEQCTVQRRRPDGACGP